MPTERRAVMRVAVLMRDKEYRDAMIERISGSDKDILIEIAGPAGIRKDAVIITDILPDEIESRSLESIRSRTLFLTPAAADSVRAADADNAPSEDSLHTLFKYSSLNVIMAELSLLFSEWSGDTSGLSRAAKVIFVCGESDELSPSRCRALAGQILYRRGGSLLIIPLGFINDYADAGMPCDRGTFRRMMYLIDDGRDISAGGFTCTDSYGISSLRLPGGLNPIAELAPENIRKLITALSMHFDTVLLDAGTCYSRVNIDIARHADNILHYGSRRRIEDPEKIFSGKIRIIDKHDERAEALAVDDYVRELYGQTQETGDDTKVPKRDRGAA